MRAELAARAAACLGLLAPGCTLALDFGPGVLQPPLDARAADATVDLAPADAIVDVAPEDAAAAADAGDCATGACRPPDCRAPEVACGARCADLQTDNRHCGACGASCGPGASHCCRGACAARCD